MKTNNLNLNVSSANNLLGNPDITLVVGQRDYAKELLDDWLFMYGLIEWEDEIGELRQKEEE